jgi:hypothetical protein
MKNPHYNQPMEATSTWPLGLLAASIAGFVTWRAFGPSSSSRSRKTVPVGQLDDHYSADQPIEEFKVSIADAQLADLKMRLDLMVPPQRVPRMGVHNELGLEPDDLCNVVEYWKNSFDWRKVETKLNEIPQYTTVIDGVKLHFLHQRAPRNKQYVNITPLLMIHGWPQTAFDYQYMIPLLTDPLAHGDGMITDAFDVVVPSMPGYTLSGEPATPKCGAKQVCLCMI